VRRAKRYSLEKGQRELIVSRIVGQLELMPEIIFAFVHGSFLEEETFGDIDLALFLDPSCPPAKDRALEYELEMERCLEKVAGFPVDVRILNCAPQPFRYSVLKNGCLLFCRDEEIYAGFFSRTLALYFDFAPYRKRYLKEVLGIEI